MKNVLIAGSGSYIGENIAQYLNGFSREYCLKIIDMEDSSWESHDFCGYDTLIFVAGIAHRKESKGNESLYYTVNRDLAVKTAQKAKSEGVRHFIFFSSMSVYGKEEGVISKFTQPTPKSHYGKSKLQAELLLSTLECEDFIVTVLRPPMIYGEGCKGNYQMLVKFAEMMPVFPDYKNKRSMLSIERLCIFVKDLVDYPHKGVFFPQDDNYVCTCEMVKQIAIEKGKRIKLLKILNPFVVLLKLCTVKGKKAFGNLVYQKDI